MKTTRILPALLLAAFAAGAPAEEFSWDGGSATLEQLLHYVKSETGTRFLYKPEDLKDKRITILAPDFKRENLLTLFEAVLEMNGLGLAASGDEQGVIYKVVPAEKLKSQPLPIFSPDDLDKLPPGDRLVTQVLTLKHIEPTQVGIVLNDLMHIIPATGSIRPVPNSNVIVLTEYASNMKRLAKIIEVMDRENAPPKLEVLPLRHATASDVTPRLNTLLSAMNPGRRNPGGGGAPAGPSVMDDPRTNSVIVIGYDEDLKAARELVAKLDLDLGAEQNTIRFFPLQHRNAKEVAEVLKSMYTEVLDAQKAKAKPGAPANPFGLNPDGTPQQPQPRANGPATAGSTEAAEVVLPRIVADEDTNSIIAIGSPRAFRDLQSAIDRLDSQRPQVIIEATVVELGERATRELGIQLASVEQPNNRSVFFGGTNFNFLTPDADDPTSATANAASGGLVAGVFKDAKNRIPVILRALAGTNDSDVIATSSLMTNDNQKAKVTIKEQQPTTTTQTGTATTNTTFSGFVDAETTVEIVPHISVRELPEGGRQPFLRLEIKQTLEKFVGAASTAGVPPPKESRSTDTSVTVPDGATVIISGFTRKDSRTTISKVPFLGDIPILGYLFRHSSKAESRTQTFLFITPRVIEGLDALEPANRDIKDRERREMKEEKLREELLGPRKDPEDLVPDWVKRKFGQGSAKEEKSPEAPAPEAP